MPARGSIVMPGDEGLQNFGLPHRHVLRVDGSTNSSSPSVQITAVTVIEVASSPPYTRGLT